MLSFIAHTSTGISLRWKRAPHLFRQDPFMRFLCHQWSRHWISDLPTSQQINKNVTPYCVCQISVLDCVPEIRQLLLGGILLGLVKEKTPKT